MLLINFITSNLFNYYRNKIVFLILASFKNKFIMKKINSLFVFAILFTLVSCSSDDAGSGNSVPFSTPLSIGSYWTYDIEDQSGINRDSLFVDSETTINNNTYKVFKAKNDAATGFYSNSLKNNNIRENNGKLLLTGDLALTAGQNLPFTIDLSLNDFIIFDKNASNNQTLNSSPKTGVINETVNGFPLTISYSLQSYGGETLSTFTSPNGMVYSNVKSTKIKLNLTITTIITVLGSPQTFTALAPQDVLVSTQYLSDGIGVVYTNTVTSYTVSNFVANELQIPESDTQTQEEFLDNYDIN